ncbi:hypothetical protein B0H17DRAFT_1188078 [Mycena rosella]|uniref:Uncharacterized protein n=1 Tax=Mycena rosella TaxID=1033263 RepID=A0AAD7BMM2_MYCRO|nr:hypothetical protein B0H17DRAFT_1188078 [Mycena rosella]
MRNLLSIQKNGGHVGNTDAQAGVGEGRELHHYDGRRHTGSPYRVSASDCSDAPPSAQRIEEGGERVGPRGVEPWEDGRGPEGGDQLIQAVGELKRQLERAGRRQRRRWGQEERCSHLQRLGDGLHVARESGAPYAEPLETRDDFKGSDLEGDFAESNERKLEIQEVEIALKSGYSRIHLVCVILRAVNYSQERLKIANPCPRIGFFRPGYSNFGEPSEPAGKISHPGASDARKQPYFGENLMWKMCCGLPMFVGGKAYDLGQGWSVHGFDSGYRQVRFQNHLIASHWSICEPQELELLMDNGNSSLFVQVSAAFAADPDRPNTGCHAPDMDSKTGPKIIFTDSMCILGKPSP